MSVSGLTTVPRKQDLKKSREIANGLPDDTDQPPISPQVQKAIGEIVARHGLLEYIGIHLMHSHFDLPEDTVLVGTNHDGYRWARATKLDDLDVDNIHGHIFALTSRGFHPYEYQTGPLPNLRAVNVGAFLEEFSGYLKMNNFETLVGLEIIDPAHRKEQMWELVLHDSMGTFMAGISQLLGCSSTRETGWQFELETGQLQVIGVAGHAHHATLGHQPGPDRPPGSNQALPSPDLGTFEAVECLLTKRGILGSA
ncbi:hypothetical protein GE09DRAFT_980663 [Coniochaeta sp. 2T2.1]|nr:hypothetical protein GE09DRAFT_980663 [Coniochaeta sp. 2T2.1]